MKLLCRIGLHTWEILGASAFDREIFVSFQCFRCGATKMETHHP